MQCVLQCPAVEMITQKETRGEFSLHKLFNSFPCFCSRFHCSDTSYSHSDSLVGTFSDQLFNFNHVIKPSSLSWTSRAPSGCVGECKNARARRATMLTWSLLNGKSKWPAMFHFLELSNQVNAGDSGCRYSSAASAKWYTPALLWGWRF